MAASRVILLTDLCHNFTKNLVLCSGHHIPRRCGSTLSNQSRCGSTLNTNQSTGLLPISQVTIIPHRNRSWMNTLTADRLWKSMTALTGKAQTKARGKKPQKRVRKDLNKGRSIGEGKAGLVWSGLHRQGDPSLQFQDDEITTPREVDPEREKFLMDMRNQQGRKKKRKLSVEEKGWTSAGWGGRSMGPPDPIPGENFEGFNSRVMFVKPVFNMTASIGRKRSMCAMVVVGNGRGALGYGLGKGSDNMSALRKAKNKAATQLQFIERFDNHTICHDLEYRFISTRVRMKKQARGQGLKCHRIIRDICQLAGITDLYAKVYGSSNPLNLVQATVKALASQETYEQIAKRTGLHVVEFRPQCGPLPIVLASPDKDKLRDDIDEAEWDKTISLEVREEKRKRDRNPFWRPGKLVANEYSATANPKPEAYTSNTHAARP